MKKILAWTLLLLLFCLPAYADQPTTVLTQYQNRSSLKVELPVLDGANNAALEKSANAILEKKVADLAKTINNNGQVSYEVKLNRPSLVSVLLKAATSGGKAVYQAVNLDLTTGREFSLDDFIQDGNARKEVLKAGYSGILFADDGIYTRATADGPYTDYVSYGKLMPLMRIGEAGRLVTVWKITEAAAERELTVPSGSLIALKVDANPSTGYTWVSDVSGGTGNLYKIGNSFTIPHDKTGSNVNRPGTPGSEIIVFAAQTKGEYTVNMSYKHAWEKGTGVKNFSFKVKVI